MLNNYYTGTYLIIIIPRFKLIVELYSRAQNQKILILFEQDYRKNLGTEI